MLIIIRSSDSEFVQLDTRSKFQQVSASCSQEKLGKTLKFIVNNCNFIPDSSKYKFFWSSFMKILNTTVHMKIKPLITKTFPCCKVQTKISQKWLIWTIAYEIIQRSQIYFQCFNSRELEVLTSRWSSASGLPRPAKRSIYFPTTKTILDEFWSRFS